MKGFFSKLSQSIMLPIALLPAAGIMLGIGGSFTNPTMIEAYNIDVLQDGSLLNSFLQVMTAAGGIVFANLPVMFALAIAVGFARAEKGAAALAALISYLVMNVAIAKTLVVANMINADANTVILMGSEYAGVLADTLGIANTLSMGVFGGLIAGAITVVLHNKYHDAKLPDYLGFFGGARFVPIISAFAALFYGIVLTFIWPFFGAAFGAIGAALGEMTASGHGYIASFIFGVIERSLIPVGLHHVFYLPLWQTEIGATAEVAGEVIKGTQNVFFASLASGDFSQFTSTNFMTGKFPFMMFGLPAAAYAMYTLADDENKKAAGGLLFSVALTAFLTGITEPIEFTFLFLSPALYYAIHVPLAGVSFMLMDMLNVKVGMTFSGGFIDFSLFGILPGVTGVENHWYYIPLVGIAYAFVYFFVFRWFIVKFDIKTPGRKGSAVAVVSKKDYHAAKGGAGDNQKAKDMIEALGGAENIVDVDACITRLRITVKSGAEVKDNDYWTQELGARGLVKVGDTGIQAIYGAEAAGYKAQINSLLGK
ncbi:MULTISPECIES: PTS transporter subunit EIIC [Vibrio]|uniref:PTS mannose transporter subunit IIB n=1 Tax=Vibrio natriegens NBRC 15636 = ATCC 14048 = DSM 759 TaxID=1219067 RepID=A0AAN0Y3J6_VIBNA|nr:PTS transporter subunit EIIC [Vibrio natriegens]MEE3879828.1 PTS transporter subunit EIIC [Vibrio sp. YYF0003]CAH0530564.1 PTS system glucose-specific EIICBA component [Catenococcus thiocycli]ALR15098.1 PTS mannose transporter subunit IIB [Vibrio natriegens NBRC 15636 = ATCC 14048 = DSM 759]ANQ13037.1 PTS mannose transporter subunit IIB [Vibrio natriegens NBRC 15636 = ATCC 14048 = DSM 759]EPM39479.1 PTS mannose transporter subunit IIB [Vibrio natriegens NBRC 15636 = ATCC 14048 = DSM 759]